MRKYDTTFIIDGSLGSSERETLIEKYKSIIEKSGGSVDRIVRWGMRSLAYVIKKRSQGYYVIFYYSAEPSLIKALEREMRINENILRYMTLVFDGKHPDYISDEDSRRSAAIYSETPAEIEETVIYDSPDSENIEDLEEEEIGVEDYLEEEIPGEEPNASENESDK
jgi:small subunit ribosomal protein S6